MPLTYVSQNVRYEAPLPLYLPTHPAQSTTFRPPSLAHTLTGMIPNNCSVNGFNYVYSENLDPSQVGYNMTITPIPFCSGLSTSTCENPLPGYNSTENLWGAWRNCESYQHCENFNF